MLTCQYHPDKGCSKRGSLSRPDNTTWGAAEAPSARLTSSCHSSAALSWFRCTLSSLRSWDSVCSLNTYQTTVPTTNKLASTHNTVPNKSSQRSDENKRCSAPPMIRLFGQALNDSHAHAPSRHP